MKTFWHNNGEADEQGNFVAEIQDDAGKTVSVFKGKSEREVADTVLSSAANASAEIKRLRGSRAPDHAPAAPQAAAPRDLSPEERLRLSYEMGDPDKVQGAVREVVQAVTGLRPEDIGAAIARMSEAEQQTYFREQTRLFLATNPDYFNHDDNEQRMVELLQLKKLDYTANNLQIVYDDLISKGLLIQRPAIESEAAAASQEQGQNPNGSAAEPNPPRPQARPRGYTVSSGMRSSDASARPPQPVAKPKLTRAELDKIPYADLKVKLRDKAFRDQVDAMPR